MAFFERFLCLACWDGVVTVFEEMEPKEGKEVGHMSRLRPLGEKVTPLWEQSQLAKGDCFPCFSALSPCGGYLAVSAPTLRLYNLKDGRDITAEKFGPKKFSSPAEDSSVVGLTSMKGGLIWVDDNDSCHILAWPDPIEDSKLGQTYVHEKKGSSHSAQPFAAKYILDDRESILTKIDESSDWMLQFKGLDYMTSVGFLGEEDVSSLVTGPKSGAHLLASLPEFKLLLLSSGVAFVYSVDRKGWKSVLLKNVKYNEPIISAATFPGNILVVVQRNGATLYKCSEAGLRLEPTIRDAI